MRAAAVLLLLGGTFGCGGDGRAGDDGGGAVDAGDALGCDPDIHCGGDGFLCGVHAVDECGEVDCGSCRYRAEDVGLGSITAARDRTIHLAFYDEAAGEVVYARVGATGLERETIQAATGVVSIDVAVADDGTVHVVFAAEQVSHAVRSEGGTWNVATVAEVEAEHALVAVDGAGAPHIFFVTLHPTTRTPQLVHAALDGTGYSSTPLEGIHAVGAPALARGDDGSITVVVRDNISAVAVLDLVDGALVRDEAAPDIPEQPATLSAAVTSDGTLHVALVSGHFTLRPGSRLERLVRSGGTWIRETLVDASASVTQDIALAPGPTDGLHLFYFSFRSEALVYTRPGSPRSLLLRQDCEEGSVDVAIDGDDQPHVIFGCDRSVSRGMLYMAPLERYPTEYLDACQTGADLICDRACECGAPDCCYSAPGSTESGGCTSGPGDADRQICVSDRLRELCGDLTDDTAMMLECRAVLETTAIMCVDASYSIPSSCWELMASNR